MDKPSRSDEVHYIADALRRLESLGASLEKWSLSALVADDIFRETLSEYQETLADVNDQLDRIERAIIELSNPDSDNREVTGKLRREMYLARIGSLKRQLKKFYDNKNILDESIADYGGRPPLELTTQVIANDEEIAKIEEELRYYRGLLDEQ